MSAITIQDDGTIILSRCFDGWEGIKNRYTQPGAHGDILFKVAGEGPRDIADAKVIIKYIQQQLEAQKVKSFKLHWLDGRTDVIQGRDIAEALARAGFGGATIQLCDYYEEIKPDNAKEGRKELNANVAESWSQHINKAPPATKKLGELFKEGSLHRGSEPIDNAADLAGGGSYHPIKKRS